MKGLARAAVANVMYHGGLWGPYFRWRPRSSGHGAAVLTLHRLVEKGTDILCKGPTVHTPVGVFEALARRLVRYYRIVPLGDIVRHLAAREPFARDSLAVVFDDGYEDNFRLGLPVFQRYGIPATIFLATGFIDSGERLWTDRIEHALRKTQCQELDTGVIGTEGHGEWLPLRSRSQRMLANHVIAERLKDRDGKAIADAVAALERHLGVSPDREQRDMLTWAEVRSLAVAGVEIASHGVSHVIMSRMPLNEAVAELRESKRMIEAQLQRPVTHFAYPNGREEDFSEPLRRACREVGYASVSTCLYGLNQPGIDDPYRVRRLSLTGGAAVSLLAMERLFRFGAAGTVVGESHMA